MNAAIGRTVDSSAIAAIQIQPAAVKRQRAGGGARDEERRRGAGRDERGEQERVDRRDDALGDQDVDRVGRAGGERERDAGRLEAARAAAEQDERRARAGERERERLPGRDVLAAERDARRRRRARDTCRAAARSATRRCAAARRRTGPPARCSRSRRARGREHDAPRGARATPSRRVDRPAAAQHDDRPEDGRGEREARRQQRRHAEPGVVRLLGEDRHQAEAAGRHEAERDARGTASVGRSAGCHAGDDRRSTDPAVALVVLATSRQATMNLQQLRYVLAAFEHGSFSAAADALHLAQPSLSEQVRRLEAELGVALFQRVGRGIVPTEAGRALRPHAEAAIAAVEAARMSVGAVRELQAGTAAFGTFGTARTYLGHRSRRGLPPPPSRRARADRRPELVGDASRRSATASSRRVSSCCRSTTAASRSARRCATRSSTSRPIRRACSAR